MRMGIRGKMTWIMILAVVLPITLVVLLSYQKFSADAIDNYIESSDTRLRAASDRLDDYISRLETLSLMVMDDKRYDTNWEKYNETMQKLVNAKTQSRDFHSMMLYFSTDDELYLVDATVNRSFYNATDILKTDWYQAIMDSKTNYVLLPQRYLKGYDKRYGVDENTNLFSFVRTDFLWGGTRRTLCMMIKPSAIGDIISAVKRYDEENYEYLSAQGGLIYTSLDTVDEDAIEKIYQAVLTDGRRSGSLQLADSRGTTVLFAISTKSGTILLEHVPNAILTAHAASVRNTGFLILLAVIVIIIPVMAILGKQISSPLLRLEKQMASAGKGEFSHKAEVKGNDEIAFISKTFNQMLDEINHLVNEKYAIELGAKTARLESLIAQINPHFIGNTLQGIGSVALEKGMPEIYTLTNALGKMMRYAIKDKNIVTLKQEKDNVSDYMFIQQFRFEENLSFEMNIPDDVLEVAMPKLILQPLVENAVVHGLEPKKGKGTVQLTCTLSAMEIEIAISDDGVGIEQTALAAMREKLAAPVEWLASDGQSIGVFNVHRRLKLMYGDAARFDIQSQEGHGTWVTVHIPRREAN